MRIKRPRRGQHVYFCSLAYDFRRKSFADFDPSKEKETLGFSRQWLSPRGPDCSADPSFRLPGRPRAEFIGFNAEGLRKSHSSGPNKRTRSQDAEESIDAMKAVSQRPVDSPVTMSSPRARKRARLPTIAGSDTEASSKIGQNPSQATISKSPDLLDKCRWEKFVFNLWTS